MRIRKYFDVSLRILVFWGLSLWTTRSPHVCAADLDVRNFQLISPGQAHLTVDAPTDQTYQFLISTNLPDWKPAGPLPPVSHGGATATYLLELDPEKPVAAYQVEYQPIPPNPVPLAALDAPANEMVSQHLPDMGMPLESDVEIEVIQGVHPFSIAHVLVTFKASTTI